MSVALAVSLNDKVILTPKPIEEKSSAAEALQTQKVPKGAQKVTSVNIRLRDKVIAYVAKATLIEMAVAFAFFGITCLFVATPYALVPLAALVAGSLVANLAVRSVAAYLRYKEINEGRTNKFSSIIQWFCPVSFSYCTDLFTRNTVVHEAGHALAALAIYKKANPKITVDPLNGGVTRYNASQLTKFGEMLGSGPSRILVAAAGPAVNLISTIASVIIANLVWKKHKMLAAYLLASAAMSTLQCATYAFSALSSTLSGHDFIRLASIGIHPIVATVIFVAVPLIIQGGFLIAYYVENKKKQLTA